MTDPSFIADSHVTYALSVTFGLDGNLYIADYFANQVVRYNPAGQFIDIFVSPGANGLNGPSYIAFGPNISAVPEPETYAMLLVGVGMLGFAALRRKENV